MRRRTVKSAAEYRGITLFTGVQSRVTVRPAVAATGIVFVRTDLAGEAGCSPIPARAEHVVPETRRTVLSLNPQERASPSVQTVEHVMSALAGLGITDAIVEVEGPEVPIGDGSALPFVQMMMDAGVVELAGAMVEPIVVRERIEIEDGRGGRIVAEPGDAQGTAGGLTLEYHLDYGPEAPLAAQAASFVSNPGEDEYAAAIAPARTFSTLEEAVAMRRMGLFGHLTAAEMLVIGPEGPVDNAYRFSDEPARHKVLDMLGDLALAGRPIQGHIMAWRTGHALNHAMAGRLGRQG